MNEDDLLRKLAAIEALFAGAKTRGERLAAGEARSRILERLRGFERSEKPVEYRFSLADGWSRRLFVALLRRYGLEPYRYKRQRRTTVMVRVPESFVREVLWPEFGQLDKVLREHLEAVTERVIGQAVHQETEEAAVVEQLELPAG